MTFGSHLTYLQGAPKVIIPSEKVYISGIIADFSTKITAFTIV